MSGHCQRLSEYSNTWVRDTLLCNPDSNGECARLCCDECSNSVEVFKKKFKLPDCDDHVDVTYKWWSTNCETGQVERNTVVKEAHEVYEALLRILDTFRIHHLTKRQQQQAFQTLTTPSFVVLHFDFAENGSLRYQDAAMSTYWHQKQVSLFTITTRSVNK